MGNQNKFSFIRSTAFPSGFYIKESGITKPENSKLSSVKASQLSQVDISPDLKNNAFFKKPF